MEYFKDAPSFSFDLLRLVFCTYIASLCKFAHVINTKNDPITLETERTSLTQNYVIHMNFFSWTKALNEFSQTPGLSRWFFRSISGCQFFQENMEPFAKKILRALNEFPPTPDLSRWFSRP